MFSSNTSQVSGGGYQISRSLRFNSADSAYLTRTPASAGNRKTWTWSGWAKRSTLSTDQTLFEVFNGNNDNQTFNIAWFSTNVISIGAYNVFWLQTTPLYRDPSAWYHIVCAVDTAQATANNRIRLYVNGSEVTAFGTRNNPTQNDDLAINQAAAHYIGTRNAGSLWLNGYLTEVNFIDGQQLTPSSFGETNAQTGVWQPIAYSGSYGTNGFYLNFSDNSNTTAATLGKDYSGNGNNWTPNNFSVAAGAGNDSLVDTPTPYGVDTGAGGEVRGNYSTFNPLKIDTNLSLANGNLDLTRANSSGWKNAEATTGVQSGKWYFEITPTGANLPANFMLGVGDPTQIAVDAYLGGTSRVWGYQGNGNYYNNGTTFGSKPTISANDVVMVAYDLDNGRLWFGKNGSWNGGGSPAAGTSPDFTNLTGIISAAAGWFAAGTASINFGQRPFAYTAPSGFRALCTQNLPTPAIGATTATQAGQYVTPVLYTGNGTDNRTISAGMTPDFVWIKSRSNAYSQALFDSVRGAGNYLSSNSTGQENFAGSLGWTNAGPTSGGFKVDQGSNGSINESSATFVAWLWKANGAGSSNTAGSITSTVSANTTSGFSVVNWTGSNSTSSQTVGHGLGVAPAFILMKNRNLTDDWFVWHSSFANLQRNYLTLNTTAAVATAANDLWGAGMTSTVVGIRPANVAANTSDNIIMYCFAAIAGYSAFGSYTGNGSSDGPFVFCGFRPAFVMVKRTDTTSNWTVLDSKRIGYNADNNQLYPNLSDAEATTDLADLLSNGFKSRSTDASVNASGGTYIYMALAENPFKFSLAR